MYNIYLDNAASTKLRDEVLEEMIESYKEDIANPSSVHTLGQNAKNKIEKSREIISGLLGVESREIIFSSGATESINFIIKGIARHYLPKGKHIITTEIEHSAVYQTCKYLEECENFEVTYLKPNRDGLISVEDLKENLRSDTILVSIIAVNNETGVVQPIKEIGEKLKENNIFFHVDAVQLIGKKIFNPKENNVSSLTVSSHKIYGPKGSGFSYLDKNYLIDSLIHGGGHELGRRAGTHNTQGIIGLSKAMELIYKDMIVEQKRELELREYLEERIYKEIDNIIINGEKSERISSISNITIKGIDIQTLMIALDLIGIYISAGSACQSGSTQGSRVLSSMGLDEEDLLSSIRISIGRHTTKEEIDIFIEELKRIVNIERGN